MLRTFRMSSSYVLLCAFCTSRNITYALCFSSLIIYGLFEDYQVVPCSTPWGSSRLGISYFHMSFEPLVYATFVHFFYKLTSQGKPFFRFTIFFFAFTYINPDYFPFLAAGVDLFHCIYPSVSRKKILTHLLHSLNISFGISSGPRYFFPLSFLIASLNSVSVVASLPWHSVAFFLLFLWQCLSCVGSRFRIHVCQV